MRTTKTIDEKLKKRLKRAISTYGMQKPILDATGIQPRTLKSLATSGAALADVVDKVVLYFKQATPPTPSTINIVCAAYEIETDRISKHSEARQIAAYLLSTQREPKMTFSEIANVLGYSNHSGVHRAIQAVSDRISVEHDLRKKVFALQAKASA